MLKAKQGKICKNYSHVKRFNTQGVYAHGQAVSFIIRHNTFIYLHMFQKKLNEVRCGAILCDHRSYHVLFRGFDRFWMVSTRAKIRQLPRSISGNFVMLHWCVLGPFAEEPLGLQLHPAVPARSQLKPSQSCSIAFHCNPVFPCISQCFLQTITQKIQEESGLPVPPPQQRILPLLPARDLTWLDTLPQWRISPLRFSGCHMVSPCIT